MQMTLTFWYMYILKDKIVIGYKTNHWCSQIKLKILLIVLLVHFVILSASKISHKKATNNNIHFRLKVMKNYNSKNFKKHGYFFLAHDKIHIDMTLTFCFKR